MKGKWFAALLVTGSLAYAIQPGGIEIDTQEWRDQPVRHLYIHGTLNGDTRFRVCLPEASAWRGRVIQYLEGALGGYELTGDAGLALRHGAVYVESNQGHRGKVATNSANDTPTELLYEASYATLQYAKARAVELYGQEPRFTYVHGDSGGGMRGSGLLERFPKTYDGAISYVGVGSTTALIPAYSRYEEVSYKLAPKLRALADAVRPGGAGDPFQVLTTSEEREALQATLKNGYPRRQLDQLSPSLVSAQLMDAIFRVADPGYVDDFWKERGTVGLDSVAGTVKAVQSLLGQGTILDTGIARDFGVLTGYSIHFTSGAAAGTWRTIVANQNTNVLVNPYSPDVSMVKAGDSFTIDNREMIAWRSYYRYLDPQSAHPRPEPLLRTLREEGRPLGQFQGKLMVLYSVDDPYAWASYAVNYDRQVWAKQGPSAKDRYRLYFFERIPHGPVTRPLWETPWGGARLKALDDMIAWVEEGVQPVAATAYTVDDLNQVVLPAEARRRLGVQPVATLTANGSRERLEVKTGEEVVFRVSADDPDNDLAKLEMDYLGQGKGAESRQVSGRPASGEFRFRYDKPGTYFANVRATDASGITNLAYVRIVVR
jgi:hypothetical protein